MLVGPQGRSGQVRKSRPPPGFDPRTVQPLASRYTDWATRPTAIYIGPKLMQNITSIHCLLYQETFCSMYCMETAAKREWTGTDLPEYSIMCEVGDGCVDFTTPVHVSGVWCKLKRTNEQSQSPSSSMYSKNIRDNKMLLCSAVTFLRGAYLTDIVITKNRRPLT